ncbi:MAG: response regulator, partial [Prevotella sp.]|nr:response regulator [Prevotella sp.]
LVNQILDERKIDKKQMQLHCTETNLVEFTRGIIALYAYNAKERNITITLESSEKKINVWIDRINFDKIINNLMSNAMKYTFDNGSINVYLSCDSANATLKVTDSGIGIKNEDAEKLFDRFYQGTNTTGFYIPGTGIGLNLCKALVNMHGGNIKAYNRGDGQKGTCMEINIPLGNAHLKPEEITTDNKDDSEEIASQGHKKNANKDFKILIVDDDHEIASYVMNELGSWYKFDYAANGREGLSKLLSSDFNLVISDVMMPEMDGITMLKKIKGNSKVSDIPVILLTSKSDIENRLEGLKRGADAFLAKPFSMEELHILIDNLVDNVRRLKGKFSGALEQEDKIENIEVKGNNALLMDKVMKCINENISDPDFNVEKLVENVGMSRAQLHRKLKEITGVSTGEFIRNLRLEQAAHLIMKGEINISQVAYAVGFNNQTHFSTVFKKHFGVAPSEYYETKHKE